MQPTKQPTCQPSGQPSVYPVGKPTSQPSSAPSGRPSSQPTKQPSNQPTCQPSLQPTSVPSSSHPSSKPSCQPRGSPSSQPTNHPSSQPSIVPTSHPTYAPSTEPTKIPTNNPSRKPTPFPTMIITTKTPSHAPSFSPTRCPSLNPTKLPTAKPSLSNLGSPTISPIRLPSVSPTAGVSMSTRVPTFAPTVITWGFIRLSMARYCDDGSCVMVTTNASLIVSELSPVFACGSIFILTDNVGQYPRCSLLDAFTVISYDIQYFEVNMLISMSSTSSVRTTCSTNIPCTNTIVIENPVRLRVGNNPVTPQVVIKASSTIGRCENLQIDLTSSTGNVGKDWKVTNISLSTGPDVPHANATSFAKSLSESFTTIKPIIIDRQALVTSHYPYEIVFTFCNIFDKCGIGSMKVNVTDSGEIPPTVFIAGSATRRITRASTLSLVANAYLTQCSNGAGSRKISAALLEVNWEVWENSTLNGMMLRTDIKSIAKDKLKFSLPAYSFEVDNNYEIRIIVTDPSSKLSGTQTIRIDVISSSLVAAITPNNGGIQPLRSGDMLTLSCLSSYDPNVAVKYSQTEFADKLEVNWQCLDNCHVQITTIPGSNDTKVLLTSSDPESIDTISTIMLTIKDRVPDRYGNYRNSTSQLTVKVIPGDAPLVLITTTPASVSKVNVKNRITLTGSVYSKTSCIAAWSIKNSATIDLQAVSVAGNSRFVSASVQTAINLVLMSSGLPALQASYMFLLTCGSSSASIIVTTNAAPSGGSYTIVPKQGIELSTVFTMTSMQWIDSDLPLSYQYGYTSGLSSSAEMIIRSRMETSYASSTLPAGSKSKGYILNTTMTVFDAYDAMTISMDWIKVSQLQTDVLQSTLKTHLANATSSLTVDELKQLITVSSTAMNRVDCEDAPDCATRNRFQCAGTSHTCGSCKDGFIGDDGDSNGYCVSPTSLVMSSGDATSCTSDVDCEVWQMCETSIDTITSIQNQQCTDKLKSCLRDCSGHGTCRYMSRNTGQYLSTDETRCTIFMTNCEAICECYSGYDTSDCSLTTTELKEKQELRVALVESLAHVVTSDSIDSQSVVNVASTLQSIVSARDEISTSIAANAVQVANQVVEQAKSLRTISFWDLLPLLSAVDTTFSLSTKQSTSVSTTNSIDTIAMAISTVSSFGDLIFSEQVEGENSTDFIYDNFRLGSHVFTILSTPLSQLEETMQSNSTATIAAMVNSSISTSTDIVRQLQAIELQRKLWRRNSSLAIVSDDSHSSGELQSNILTVKTYNVDKVTVTIGRLSDYSDTEILHYNFTTTCLENEYYNYTFTCPDSGITLTNACTGQAGIHETICPSITMSCSTLSMIDQSIDSNSLCTVVNSTAIDILCECQVPTQAIVERRRLSGTDSSTGDGITDEILYETGALTMGLLVYYVANDFKNTFKAAPNALSTTNDVERVLIVIVMYSVLWSLGLICIGYFGFQQYHYNKKKRKAIESFSNDIVQRDGVGHKGVRSRGHIPLNVNIGSQPVVKDVINLTTGDASSMIQLPQQHVVSTNHIKEKLSNYVKSVIPNVFNTSSIFVGMKNELIRHHAYLRLFLYSANTNRLPVLIVCQLLTIQTIMMFLLAVLYDLQGPDDDGSCSRYYTKTTCLSRKSLFDSTETFCTWTSESNDSGTCSYHVIDVSFEVGVYCAIVASIITALLLRPVEFLFAVLAAPTRSSSAIRPDSTSNSLVNKSLPSRRSMMISKSTQGSQPTSIWGILNQRAKNLTARFIPEETKVAYRQARMSIMIPMNSLNLDTLKIDTRRNSTTINQEFTRLCKDLAYTRDCLISSVDNDTTAIVKQIDIREVPDNNDSEMIDFFDDVWGLKHDNNLMSNIQRYSNTNKSKTIELEKDDSIASVEEVSSEDSNEHYDVFSTLQRRLSTLLIKSQKIQPVEQEISVTTIMKDELDYVKEESLHWSELLSNAKDDRIGVEILQLFIQDLLGHNTPAAKIFHAKAEEDYTTMSIVNKKQKIASIIILFILNLFFIYYSILRGYQKGVKWQYSYVFACMIQSVADIIFFETLECLYIHYFIPHMISSYELNKVSNILHVCIDKLCESTTWHTTLVHDSGSSGSSSQQPTNTISDSVEIEKGRIIDVPNYFFISTNIAKCYPKLMESMIVLTYHTALPGEIGYKWNIHTNSPTTMLPVKEEQEERSPPSILSLITTFLSFVIVQLVSSIPLEFQRIILRFIEPGILGAMAFIWRYISMTVIGTVVFAGVMVIIPCVLFVWYRRSLRISDDSDINRQTSEYGVIDRQTKRIESLLAERIHNVRESQHVADPSLVSHDPTLENDPSESLPAAVVNAEHTVIVPTSHAITVNNDRWEEKSNEHSEGHSHHDNHHTRHQRKSKVSTTDSESVNQQVTIEVNNNDEDDVSIIDYSISSHSSMSSDSDFDDENDWEFEDLV